MQEVNINFDKLIKKNGVENASLTIPSEHTLPIEYATTASGPNCVSAQAPHNEYVRRKFYEYWKK